MTGPPAQPLLRADRSLPPSTDQEVSLSPAPLRSRGSWYQGQGCRVWGQDKVVGQGRGGGVGISERLAAPAPPAPCRAACLVRSSTSSGSKRRSVAASLPGTVPGDFTYRETLFSRVWTVGGGAFRGPGRTPELVATELPPPHKG